MFAPLLLLLACGPSPADLLKAGLNAAAAGDPEAWEICGRMDRGEGRGACRVVAARALEGDDRAEACAEISTDHWRDECWFDLAEHHAADQRWDAAMDACERAGDYRVDCARHLAEETFRRPDGDAVLVALYARFPDAAKALEMNREQIEARTADTRERIEEAAALDAIHQSGVVSLASCAPQDRDACRETAAKVLEERWRKAAQRQAQRRAALCGGKAAETDVPRLRWEPDPVLDARMAALRVELCGGDDSAPPDDAAP